MKHTPAQPYNLRLLGFLGVFVLLLTLPVTFLLSQQQQETREHAAGPIHTLTPIPTLQPTCIPQPLTSPVTCGVNVGFPTCPTGYMCAGGPTEQGTCLPIVGWCPPSISPKPSCIIPPPCVNSTPRCLPPVPIGGWCLITPTMVSTGTIFSTTLYLHGIGFGGDNVNPHAEGNPNPSHPERTVSLSLYDRNNKLTETKQGTVTYASASGNFIGDINMGNVTKGVYVVQVKVDGFLSKQIPGIQTVNITAKPLPPVALVAGDINNDNQLDLLDYNILISCFGSKQSTSTCLQPPSSLSSGADINDDGVVDGTDYNVFLRELSVQTGDSGPTVSPTPTNQPTVTIQITPSLTPPPGCYYGACPLLCSQTNPNCCQNYNRPLICPSGTPAPSSSPLGCNSCLQKNQPYFCRITVSQTTFCSSNANACAGQGNCYCSLCGNTTPTPTP